MFSISSSPSMAPQPMAYTQVGQIPVGQESAQQRLQRIRPVEQTPTVASASDNKRAKTEVQPDSSDSVAGVSDQDKRKQAQQAVKEKLEQAEQEQLKQMVSRDREVRAHEQAHKAVAGSYGGAIHYEYERGPDGNRYVVGGEVSIDTSPESSPEATLAKARIIQRAANAPAEPSDQDRAVAAQAAQMEQMALQQLAQSQQDSSKGEPAQQSTLPVDSSAKEPALVSGEKRDETVNGLDLNGVDQLQPGKPDSSNQSLSSVTTDNQDKRMGLYRKDDSASLNFHAHA